MNFPREIQFLIAHLAIDEIKACVRFCKVCKYFRDLLRERPAIVPLALYGLGSDFGSFPRLPIIFSTLRIEHRDEGLPELNQVLVDYQVRRLQESKDRKLVLTGSKFLTTIETPGSVLLKGYFPALRNLACSQIRGRAWQIPNVEKLSFWCPTSSVLTLSADVFFTQLPKLRVFEVKYKLSLTLLMSFYDDRMDFLREKMSHTLANLPKGDPRVTISLEISPFSFEGWKIFKTEIIMVMKRFKVATLSIRVANARFDWGGFFYHLFPHSPTLKK